MKKLSLLYTFWTGDDVEMLMRSIKHHTPFVDEIIVCLQSTSNKGEYCIVQNHLCDMFLELKPMSDWYDPNLTISTKENERIKHNKMIQHAKKGGATHFIMAAADHFYDERVFINSIEAMKTGKYDVILTKMRTYYKHENWTLYPLEDYYMPFIHKMYDNTEISKTAYYPVVVDPSVKVNTSNFFYIMPESDGLLDHYSMVRKDIKKKFRNAAASIRWTPEQVERFISEYENAKVGDNIEYFGGREIISI